MTEFVAVWFGIGVGLMLLSAGVAALVMALAVAVVGLPFALLVWAGERVRHMFGAR